MIWALRIIGAFLRYHRKKTISLTLAIAIPLALVASISSYNETSSYTLEDQANMLMGSAGVSISAIRTTTSFEELESLNNSVEAIKPSDGFRIHVLDAEVGDDSNVLAAISDLQAPVFNGMYGVLDGELADDSIARTSAAARELTLGVGDSLTVGVNEFKIGAIVASYVPQYDFIAYVPFSFIDRVTPKEECQATWYFQQLSDAEILKATQAGLGVFPRDFAKDDYQYPRSPASHLVPILFIVSWCLIAALAIIHASNMRRLDL